MNIVGYSGMIKYKSTFTGVPLWVNIVHYWVGRVAHIMSSISYSLMCFSINLIDKHCKCDKCQGKYAK